MRRGVLDLAVAVCATASVLALLVVDWQAEVSAASGGSGAHPPPLVFHAETAGGRVIESRDADRALNPASLTKLATTLWALEELGPGHRFETVFSGRGSADRDAAAWNGDLLVTGGADPDFHIENAFLVAAALNGSGIARVTGDLVVGPRFWIGWEGGSERRERDPARRSALMARRLRNALDSSRWNAATRRGWEEFAARRGLDSADPPSVTVAGEPRGAAELPGGKPLLVHRSNPLQSTLKRFNSYSNNDIERFEASLGSPAEMAQRLARRWEAPRDQVRFETLSGLGTNRLTPRLIVQLLRDVDRACRRHGLTPGRVLPVSGCDPGTLEEFPALAENHVPGKTGTLTTTDGGVTLLAGFIETAKEPVLFSVATPGSGRRPAPARAEQQRWSVELISGLEQVVVPPCGAAMPFSDDQATVIPSR